MNSSFQVIPDSGIFLFFVKNQLVSKQEVKLQVVHRNSELLLRPEILLSTQLQKVYRDLDDMAKLIEREVANDLTSTGATT